jgi:hypothetical protein
MLCWRILRRHWLSLTACLVVGAALRYVNLAGYRECGLVNYYGMRGYQFCLVGWPLRSWDGWRLVVGSPPSTLDFGTPRWTSRGTFYPMGAAIDAVVAVAMLASVWVACEKLARRRTWLQFTLRDLFMILSLPALCLALLHIGRACGRLWPELADCPAASDYPWYIYGPIVLGWVCLSWHAVVLSSRLIRGTGRFWCRKKVPRAVPGSAGPWSV